MPPTPQRFHPSRPIRHRRLFVPALLLGLGLPDLGAARDAAKLQSYGRHLAQECSGCHRLDGIDNGIPSITGWGAEQFVATLKFYQAATRTNPVMMSVASSLDEEQMQALAAFYGSLPKRASLPPAGTGAPQAKR